MSASLVWISAMRCGSCAVSASARSAARSRSAVSTTSSRLSGPLGASCARRPMRQRGGISTSPCSAETSPVITPNSVVLPVPLRPTRPTRAPAGMLAPVDSSSARPPMRTVRSAMTSMGSALWPSRRRDAIPRMVGQGSTPPRLPGESAPAISRALTSVLPDSSGEGKIRWRSSVPFRSSSPTPPRAT